MEIKKVLFIDFEASSLAENSFPIEVGLACINEHEIQSESKLIKPDPCWDLTTWSGESEQLHGIAFAELQVAELASDVATWLAEAIAGHVLISDAPAFDQRWLDMMLAIIGANSSVQLHDFDALCGGLNLEQLRLIYGSLDANPAPHRAGPDAARLAGAYGKGVTLR